MLIAVARIWPITLVLLAFLGCDFVVFIMRRHRVLARYNAGQPRLSTADDFRAVDDAYTQRGEKPPTMTDFEKAAGFAFVPEWRTALRYREVGRFYADGLLVDIGCGDGRLCWRYHACPPQNYYGVDAPGLVAILREKTNDVAHALAGTAEATTLPDHHADLIVCSECFEHLTEPGVALREFCRILKPAGRIVIQSPSARRLRNLNPLHLIATYLGRWLPRILLPAMVHENTFVDAYTYHWDFTRQDIEAFISDLPLTIEALHGAVYRFNPNGNLLHRLAYRVARWPVVNWLWWNMTIVLRKTCTRIDG
jgi:ubiquinone/menaquinone biosynthesis C-methylase UbiE